MVGGVLASCMWVKVCRTIGRGLNSAAACVFLMFDHAALRGNRYRLGGDVS